MKSDHDTSPRTQRTPQWLRSFPRRGLSKTIPANRLRLLSVAVLFPVMVLSFYFSWKLEYGMFSQTFPLQLSPAPSTSAAFWSPMRKPKTCRVLAMIITSESDYQNGTLDAWFQTLPPAQSDQVCCVSIRRSRTSISYFKPSPITCDVVFLPMIRDDEYLTISEKVILGLQHLTKYYNFDWLLKADADSFLCFSKLWRIVANFDPTANIHIGHPESRNRILDDPENKWYDPSMADITHNTRQDLIPDSSYYHQYMQGAAYILSRGAVDTLQSMLPRLRYSPMEDAMVGSWMLALRTHRATMRVDLRGSRRECKMQETLSVSHHKRRARDLLLCAAQNKDCMKLRTEKDFDITDVSFIIPLSMSGNTNVFMEQYNSIRAMLPQNEILVGDMSKSDRFVSRLLRMKIDNNLVARSFPDAQKSTVKNALVKMASSKYVCILEEVHRPSWETLIAKMVRPLKAKKAEIVGGFLKFNPYLQQGSAGVFPNGYNYSYSKVEGMVSKSAFKAGNISELAEVCTPAKGADGFIVARRDFLIQHPWRNLGLFSDDEFYLRLNQKGVRIVICNSGVRYSYHHVMVHKETSQEEVRSFAPQMCTALGQLKQKVSGFIGLNNTLDCGKRLYTRWNGDAGLKW